MVKKEVLLAFSIFAILFSAFLVSATSDVAYIYRKNFKIDDNVLQVFNESGLTVDLINEQDLPIQFDNYRFIYVGDENFRKENLIPVNSVPSVVANYYHAPIWGLTDPEGVSQLASNDPLKVIKDSRLTQVYTQAREYVGGPAISYYFLGTENQAEDLETVATTEVTSSGSDFGDVIAYANPGAQMTNGKTQSSKLCFYGIIESDYWTNAAKDMFKDCVKFVAAECTVDADCSGTTYSDNYCSNGDSYRNVTTYTCQNGGLLSQCVPSETTELVEECSYDCQSGQCVGECETNADCGTDGAFGDLFCSADNVTQFYETFTCIEAGTSNAHCSSETSNQTVETCSDICLSGQCEEVECFDNSECNDNNSSTEDLCHEQGTPQSYCSNDPITCSDDTDCGTNGFTTDPFCSDLDLFRTFKTYTCYNSGTAASYCDSTTSNQLIEQCTDACVTDHCEDIACYADSECDDQNPMTFDKCTNNGTILSQCQNTPINCASNDDCGFTGFTGNETCQSNNVVKTFHNSTCVNPGTLDSHCVVTDKKLTIEQCAEICVAGECTSAQCTQDSDCEDFNPLTLDECINPSTILSQCRNTPITCASDNDCGTTGFVGTEYCSGNEILRNYQTSTCTNPGETSSSCDSESTSQLIDTCDFACANGDCVRCDENSDCDDSNPNTQDICFNPDTIDSFCTNDPVQENITCSSDSDCGVDTPMSDPFCSDTTINQLVQTWTCNNPNTQQSYCSSNLVTNAIETCSDYCLNGECANITCFNHADCDDQDATTLDLCNNPGTAQSYCTNNPINIICSSDSDCGTDGFISNEFCSGDNVARLFQEHECNNQGTIESYCSTSVSQITTEECDSQCVNGECVPEQGDCTPGEIRTCSTNVGACTEGINVCFTNAIWSTECFGGILPATEICDGVDNDCDGSIDEGDVCGQTCSNECSQGERECYQDGYRICGDFDSDSCYEWSSKNECSTGEVCEYGECVTPQPTCTNECNFAERTCSSSGTYKICGDFDSDSCYEWSTDNYCSTGDVCIGGNCI